MKRHVDFGDSSLSDNESDDESEAGSKNEYIQDFKTEQFTKITKLAGLSNNMQIFPRDGKPLMFRSQVGSLGRIMIYLKSQEEISNEIKMNENENDNEEEF